MKTDRNILIAFLLNLSFSAFEFVGGVFTGSVAIMSDAVHDIGDAASIGVSYFLEKKSKKRPDDKYTYGYGRYSVVGGLITTLILLIGSAAMLYNAVDRLFVTTAINYNGMILLAVVGVFVNFCAALFTREGGSINQKAVNLHMIEDVLGWIVVLAGAIVMRFTNFALLDPIMSIAVSLFIVLNAIKNIREGTELLLEKVPDNIDVTEIREHVKDVDGVLDAYHFHVWSIDGQNNLATMHIITDQESDEVKITIREVLREHGITHATIEIDKSKEHCYEKQCDIECSTNLLHKHHHKHHSN